MIYFTALSVAQTQTSGWLMNWNTFGKKRWGTNPTFSWKVKGKIIPVLNELSTRPWWYMWEWRYSSTFLNLGIRWSWLVSFRHVPLSSGGNNSGAHSIGGWVALISGLDVTEKERNLLPLPRIEHRLFGPPFHSLVATLIKLSWLRHFQGWAEKNHENLRIAGVPAAIRTEHVLHTSLQGYHYSNLFDRSQFRAIMLKR
jgi:hypothetical protein